MEKLTSGGLNDFMGRLLLFAKMKDIKEIKADISEVKEDIKTAKNLKLSTSELENELQDLIEELMQVEAEYQIDFDKLKKSRNIENKTLLN